MKLNKLLFFLFSIPILTFPSYTQIITFPFSENFDSSPNLPSGWSSNGFSINTSSVRSSPNCVAATGNRSVKTLISPVFNFTNRLPDKLIFYERRTSTAVPFRLEIRASLDNINYSILLARFDTITTTTSYVQRVVNLASSGLYFQPNVQFAWIILADSTNNTGVLRIDDVTLTVSIGYDVGLTKMLSLSSAISRMDTLLFSITAKNFGTLTASDFSIRLFYDKNSNWTAEMDEIFSVIRGLLLNAGDSLTHVFTHNPLKPGEHRFIAVIDFPQDENRNNDTIHTLINVGNVRGDILVNEIMYAPTADEPEWVELYNTSPDTINLKNWRISDSNISTKTIITTNNIYIAPDSYQIVAKDQNFSVIYPSVPYLTANFLALNNTTPDAVVIYDSKTNTIDSIMYAPTWGGQNGKSLERVDLLAPSTLMTNWASSKDSMNATPGKINSIARLNYDLALTSISTAQTILNNKNFPVINFTIQNVGRKICDSALVYFYADNNRNSIGEVAELLDSTLITQIIIPNDSLKDSKQLTKLSSGETSIIIAINWWRDERLRNNYAFIPVKVEFEVGLIVINEIMYEPIKNQNEWIELYNRSDQPVDICNWTFNDKATTSGVNSFKISNKPLLIKPSEFVVIAAESSLFQLFPNLLQDSTLHTIILNRSGGFSFNNDGDAVVLKDLTGNAIDSVYYLPAWHHLEVNDTRGRSLERINPDINSNDARNWSTCTKSIGGTPGKSNSVLTTSPQNSTRLSISPNPFSPDGDGFEDFCIIRYNLPIITSTINVKIFDIKGRLIRTLSNCELAGYTGEIIWDGYGDDKRRARVGVYVVYLEASDRISGRIETAKAVAVVATKL